MQTTYFLLAVALILATLIGLRLIFPTPRLNETMKRNFVYEVVQLVHETKSKKEKVDVLFSNMGPGLAGILRMNFDESVCLDVDLDIQYRPRKKFDFIQTLNHSSKIWKGLTKQSASTRVKKNLRFKAMLESLEPREAELFLQAAQRQLKLGLSKMTLTKCFPQIFKKS